MATSTSSSPTVCVYVPLWQDSSNGVVFDGKRLCHLRLSGEAERSGSISDHVGGDGVGIQHLLSSLFHKEPHDTAKLRPNQLLRFLYCLHLYCGWFGLLPHVRHNAYMESEGWDGEDCQSGPFLCTTSPFPPLPFHLLPCHPFSPPLSLCSSPPSFSFPLSPSPPFLLPSLTLALPPPRILVLHSLAKDRQSWEPRNIVLLGEVCFHGSIYFSQENPLRFQLSCCFHVFWSQLFAVATPTGDWGNK